MDNYTKSYKLPQDSKEEKHNTENESANTSKEQESRKPTSNPPAGTRGVKYWIAWALAFMLVTIGWNLISHPSKESTTNNPSATEMTDEEDFDTNTEDYDEAENTDGETDDKESDDCTTFQLEEHDGDKTIATKPAPATQQPKPDKSKKPKDESTLDILERTNHEQVVKQAKREGVSTEGSTLDILERINHAQAVKQAKREGVSTEGSTLDILERINHAQAVKQAKREGVSTEGSTLDILERINNKNLKKRK